jgi:hypothetical protein
VIRLKTWLLAINASSVLVIRGRSCDVLVVTNGIFSMLGHLKVVCKTQGGDKGVFDLPSMTGAVGEDRHDRIKDMTISSLAADSNGAQGRGCQVPVVTNSVLSMPGDSQMACEIGKIKRIFKSIIYDRSNQRR